MAKRLEKRFKEPTPTNIEIGDLLLDVIEVDNYKTTIQFVLGGEITEITSEKIKTNKRWECKYSQALILKKDNTYLIGKEVQSYLNNFQKLEQLAQSEKTKS